MRKFVQAKLLTAKVLQTNSLVAPSAMLQVLRMPEIAVFEELGAHLSRPGARRSGLVNAIGVRGTPLPTHLENKGFTARLCVSSAKQRYLQAKSCKQEAYRRCLRRFGYREF